MRAVGVGKSTSRDARAAGREAARAALRDADVDRARGVLVFSTGGHDQREMLRGVVEVTGAAPLAGCSTSGVITAGGLDESTHAVGVLAIASDALSLATFRADGLGDDPAATGRALAERVDARADADASVLMLFADGRTGSITELLAGLEGSLRRPLAIVGGTAGALLQLRDSWQYHDGAAVSGAVTALRLGGVVADVAVSHGCEAIGAVQTVTRAQGGWIFEIDGQPAWSVYQQYLDRDLDRELDRGKAADGFSMSHVCYLCLAEEAAPGEEELAIRCPLRLDRDTGAMFFPGSIRTGARVRMALRSAERTVERARASAEAIVARHRGARPTLVLQFDCCCRGRLLFGRRTDQAAVATVREAFGADVPWFGFSTYGEISPLRTGERARFHNYSAVLCALYPRAS